MTYLILALTLLTQDPLDTLDAKQGLKKAAPPPVATAPVLPGANDTKPNIPGFSDAAGQPTPNAVPPAEAKSEEKPAEESVSDSGIGFWDWVDKMMHTGAMGLMVRGGIFMWPILACGVLMAGVIIERYRTLKMLTTDASVLRREVTVLLQQDKIDEALAKCDSVQGPIAAILSAGLGEYAVLRRLGHDPAEALGDVVKAMDDYGVHIVAALEKHLSILATVSSVAPMLGFLGTVSGMVNGFDHIVATLGEQNIVKAAADGIAEALLTTALGLIVGIPAFTGYNYFTGVINQFVLEVEETATDLVKTLRLEIAVDAIDAKETQS